jgi:1-acyl-sn-glycerol-3-phosphate acyltransferase
VLRLVLLGCHVAAGLAAALFFPLLPRAARSTLQAWWSRGALLALGVRLATQGEAPRPGSLIVANHVSWLDVLAISSVCGGASFVCKLEIASWPVLGWMLERAGTVFMRRASAWGAWRAVLAIAPQLGAGASIAVFPEGTTTPGDDVLPFYPALFQAAVNARAPVQPVALLYMDREGARRYEAIYVGETSFGESLLGIAAARGLQVSLALLPAFSAAELSRREAAQRARESITSRIRHVEVAAPSQPEPILRAA